MRNSQLLTKIFIVFGASLISFSASAVSLERCFNEASLRYQIPEKLLKAIAHTETRMNPLALNYNKNGSYDMGIMQINSYWLPKLNRVGIQKEELFDGCENIQVGAWILSENIKRYGFGLKAIGAYNATTPALQMKYANKVMKNMERI